MEKNNESLPAVQLVIFCSKVTLCYNQFLYHKVSACYTVPPLWRCNCIIWYIPSDSQKF